MTAFAFASGDPFSPYCFGSGRYHDGKGMDFFHFGVVMDAFPPPRFGWRCLLPHPLGGASSAPTPTADDTTDTTQSTCSRAIQKKSKKYTTNVCSLVIMDLAHPKDVAHAPPRERTMHRGQTFRTNTFRLACGAVAMDGR